MEAKKAAREAEKERRANTFKKLALEWHKRQVDHLAECTREVIMRRLRRDVFPVIGDTPLSEISFRLILEKVLHPIEDRTAIYLSHLIRSVMSQILRYGVACELCDLDLTADLRGALKPIPRRHSIFHPQPSQRKNLPALTSFLLHTRHRFVWKIGGEAF